MYLLKHKRLMKSYNLLGDTKLLFKEMLSAIEQSKVKIDVQFMTFEGDSIGIEFANNLVNAKKRGVEVRVLIDSYTDFILSDKPLFSPHLPHTYFKLWQEKKATKKMIQDMVSVGIKVERTNPVSLKQFWKFKNHDHRKLLIIDESIAFVGGFNLSEHNYSWHDTAVEIYDKEVIEVLSNIYDDTFEGRQEQNIIKIDENVQIYSDNQLIVGNISELIRSSTERVFIESGYFREIGILNLISSNKKVENLIVIPKKNNQWIVQFFQNRMIKNADSNINIVKREGMTHAKLALLDDIVVFGSSNFESRGVKELTMFVENKELADQVYEYFLSAKD